MVRRAALLFATPFFFAGRFVAAFFFVGTLLAVGLAVAFFLAGASGTGSGRASSARKRCSRVEVAFGREAEHPELALHLGAHDRADSSLRRRLISTSSSTAAPSWSRAS